MNLKKLLDTLGVADNSNQSFSAEVIVPVANDASENKIEEYIAHLATIVEFSEDAIISESLDGIIKSWNKGSEKMYGYTAKEMIGTNISIIIPPEYMDYEKKILERISNNEAVSHYETVRINGDGQQIYVSLAVSPLKNAEGTVIGFSKIGRDITASKRSEAALVYANKKLELQNLEKEKRSAELIIINRELTLAHTRLREVNNELEAFTYSVSHDLRAPLRAVNSYAQILEEDYAKALDADGKQILENIRYNTKKMGVLIDELLSFSRLGRKEIDRTDIDMNDLIKTVVEEINRTIQHKASIKVSQLPPVKGDYILLHQVLFNLLSNAIKYSSKKDDPIVEVFAEHHNNKTVFAIKDNGVGFDMRFADKLFGVFQRLHSEKEFEGNGVGLAIVQRIISKHGGNISVEGKENEGATFYFTIN